PPAAESYLNVELIIDAALKARVDAIHPGYGFLSENPDFAEACQAAEIAFIGPPSSVIRTMGSKSTARQLAAEIGVPVVPGYDADTQNVDLLRQQAQTIGFPLLIKACAGGGGRGVGDGRPPREVLGAGEVPPPPAGPAF